MKQLYTELDFWQTGEQVSLRDGFGRVLCTAAKYRNDFVLFDADVAGATGAKPFVQKFPERVMQFGIAEQNMMAAAAGFSDSGMIPIVSTFAVFGLMRAHEQFRTAVAYPNRNVKLCCSHLGLDVGPDGATAQCIEDIAISRSIPNVTVISPADANEFMLAFLKVIDHQGPVYLRIGRSPAPVIFDESHEFKIGKASVLKDGNDITIIASGVMVARALEAAEKLLENDVNASVINLSTIKPLDKKTILDSVKETNCVVTAEDHNIHGGVGSAVSELLAENYPVPVKMVGIRDIFGKSGEHDELAELYGLTSGSIADAAIEIVKKKRGIYAEREEMYNNRW